jgi:D-serine deaminase-like pyridoxal phosphate-dependent protein
MRRLTVEIDYVLSGQPPPVRSQQPSLSAALAVTGDDTALSIAGVEAFERHAAGHRGEGVAEQAAGWLGRARRERRDERARSAISWTVVFLFVAVIAGASAYLVRGGLPEPAALERAMRSIGL